jgi:hypothetical protein
MLILLGLLIAIALPLIDAAVFRPRRRSLPQSRLSKAELLIYVLFILSVALMALSSLGMLLVGGRMHRWMLILHMSVAPLFAIALTILALLWAEQNAAERVAATASTDDRILPGEKLAFWLVVVTGLLTTATAMLLMMSWFGSDAQHTLLNLHTYSALVLLIATVYQAYRLLAGRPTAAKA